MGEFDLINANITRNKNGKYNHEYIIIDKKSYKRYKVSFETESMKVSIYEKYNYCYDGCLNTRIKTFVLKESGIIEKNGVVINMEELDK